MTRATSAPAVRILVLDRSRELAARIRHNVVVPQAVVENCPDLARAETHLATAPWDVIVAGPSHMHRGGLRRLGALHQRYPWVAIVLALNERPRADLNEIVQVGADDLLPLHANDAELRRTLTRAVRISRGRLGVATGGSRGTGRGRIVMVSSASGGCGKTFLATNAAEFLVRTTDQPVVLVDLDLQFGEVSTALRLRPEVTITDALAAEAEGNDLDEILDDYLLTHPDGFRVLAAPRLPAEADSVTPGDVARILDVLRARGAWVVIDSHEGLSELFVAALEATDHVFAVATPDRPSLVNLGRFLSALERLGMAAGNISVVLNKAEEDSGFDAVEMAAQLGRTFEAVLPYSRDVSRSINVGVPMIVNKPKSPVSTLLTTALSAVLPRSGRTATPAPAIPAPVPAPGPEPIDLTVPAEPPRDNDVPEIDLTDPLPRPCPVTAPVRPVSRGRLCRLTPTLSGGHPPSPGRSAAQPIGGPCRGRGPPRPRVACGPGPPARRAEFASSKMRAPPAGLFAADMARLAPRTSPRTTIK